MAAAWHSGLKTVDTPGGNRRPHMRTHVRPSDTNPVTHQDPPSPFPTAQEKSGELRHRSRPSTASDLLYHTADSVAPSPSLDSGRFRARKEIEHTQLTRPQRQEGRKLAEPDRYVSQEPNARLTADPFNSQRFQSRPATRSGLLQSDDAHVSSAGPLGQRFQSTPNPTKNVTIPAERHEIPHDPRTERGRLQRMRATPPDGSLNVGRSSESEQLRFYNSTRGQPTSILS